MLPCWSEPPRGKNSSLRLSQSVQVRNRTQNVQRSNKILAEIFFWQNSNTTSGEEDEGGEEGEEGEEAEEKVPSCGDYVMHFLTIFWKIIFACVPPTGTYLEMLKISLYDSNI